jgi:hypothetical protein
MVGTLVKPPASAITVRKSFHGFGPARSSRASSVLSARMAAYLGSSFSRR